MNRFWLFPLILGVASAPFPQLTFLEALPPMILLDGHFPTLRTLLSDLGEIWTIAAPYSVAAGMLLGEGLALFDWLRNRRRSSREAASKLLLNLWWCGVYATTLNVFNALLCLAIAHAVPVSGGNSFGTRILVFVPLLMVAILNLGAIVWASVRSVSNSDVLSPRVLGSKFRRSARIEG